MVDQVNQLLQPVQTPTGQSITTTVQNSVASAGATVKTAALNTRNVIVGEVGGAVSGIVTGAIGQAVAPVIDVAKKGKQVYDLVTNPTLGGALSLLGRGLPPYRNELDQFASYNYIFTLGCLTGLELNFPISYRTLGPAIKIIKSGGTAGNQIPTIYETDGAREYYIEDVEIKNHCAPNPGTRLSNATSISFKVIEPYSMGQFFHSLRTAALVAGHANYLTAPFLLSVKFIGYNEDGEVAEPIFSQRHIPIRIVQSDMKVTEAGATYDIKAIPYNETALTNTVNVTTQDTQLKGRTVAEVLQTGLESLTAKINSVQTEQVRANQKPAEDHYIISFPSPGITESLSNVASIAGATTAGVQSEYQRLYESISGDTSGEIPPSLQEKLSALPGATTLGSPLAEQLRQIAASDINSIGASTINLSGVNMCMNPAYEEASFVEDPERPGSFTRGRIIYNSNETFSFRNATRITDIIEEVILASEWGREYVKQTPDANGQLEGFSIHTHVYSGSSLFGELVTGQSPKIYVYRVVPYKYDASIQSSPQTGIFDLIGKQANAVKAYNYIYTGQNNEIIDFELHFNQAFYTGAQSMRAQRQIAQVLGGSMSITEPETQPTTTTNTDGASASSAGAEGASRTMDVPGVDSGTNAVSGGGGSNDTAASLARAWTDTLIHSNNDLLKVDLTINGDPYFISDAGLGNWLGIDNPIHSAITIEGSMNPIKGQVPIILNFRTPIDYNEDDGFVKYPLGGFLPIAMFSGVYRVLMVNNHFKQGRFTQTLELARMRNQDLSLEKIGSALLTAIGGTSVGQYFGLGTKDNQMGDGGQTS